MDVAGSLAGVADPDVRGHLALTRSELEEVPGEACRFSLAQYRLGARYVVADKPRSAVVASREAMIGGSFVADDLGRAPLWRTGG